VGGALAVVDVSCELYCEISAAVHAPGVNGVGGAQVSIMNGVDDAHDPLSPESLCEPVWSWLADESLTGPPESLVDPSVLLPLSPVWAGPESCVVPPPLFDDDEQPIPYAVSVTTPAIDNTPKIFVNAMTVLLKPKRLWMPQANILLVTSRSQTGSQPFASWSRGLVGFESSRSRP